MWLVAAPVIMLLDINGEASARSTIINDLLCGVLAELIQGFAEKNGGELIISGEQSSAV